MEIYVGAYGQNKLDVVMLNDELMFNKPHKIAVDGEYATKEQIDAASIINHFHLYVKRNLSYFSSGENVDIWIEKWMANDSNKIIISDEIGNGIVPLDPDEREYREVYGRVMCRLTQYASRVTRIVCGICQVVKDSQ